MSQLELKIQQLIQAHQGTVAKLSNVQKELQRKDVELENLRTTVEALRTEQVKTVSEKKAINEIKRKREHLKRSLNQLLSLVERLEERSCQTTSSK